MALKNPSWQVDIPSLSQLLVNLGSAGLKQLANSGVDLHTMACMLKLAELVPACQEIRGEINEARKKQRSSRYMLYKLIELGAATNFPADFLLRTRAGENVIALITSFSPMFPRPNCVATLERIFELRKIPVEEIPSLSQLQAFLDVLLPLCLDIHIKDKIIQVSMLIKAVMKRQGRPVFIDRQVNHSIFNSLSCPDSAAQLIICLHELVGRQDGSILVWSGMDGSAWVAVYAVYILGLPTCALGPEGEVPINSPYFSARVVLDLESKQCSFGVYQRMSKLDPKELIDSYKVKQFDDSNSRSNPPLDIVSSGDWLFDCSQVNFLTFYLDERLETGIYNLISDVVVVTALDMLHPFLSRLWSSDHYENIEVFTIDSWKLRLLRILKILGFRVFSAEKYSMDTWDQRVCGFCFHADKAPVPIDLQQRFACFQEEGWNTAFTMFRTGQSLTKTALAQVSRRAISLAVTLAMTDWEDAWRKLPLSILARCEYDSRAETLFLQLSNNVLTDEGQKWLFNFDAALHRALGIPIEVTERMYLVNTAAYRVGGATLMRTFVDYKDPVWKVGVFYRIFAGPIRYQDRVFHAIQSVDYQSSSKPFDPILESSTAAQSVRRLYESGESDGFHHDMQISAMVNVFAGRLWLALEIFKDKMLLTNVAYQHIFALLPARFIPLACSHAFAPLPISTRVEDGRQETFLEGTSWTWNSALGIATHSENKYQKVRLVPSPMCSELQWVLATVNLCIYDEKLVQDGPFSGDVYDLVVLQIATCLSCVLNQLEQRWQKISLPFKDRILVIPMWLEPRNRNKPTNPETP